MTTYLKHSVCIHRVPFVIRFCAYCCCCLHTRNLTTKQTVSYDSHPYIDAVFSFAYIVSPWMRTNTNAPHTSCQPLKERVHRCAKQWYTVAHFERIDFVDGGRCINSGSGQSKFPHSNLRAPHQNSWRANYAESLSPARLSRLPFQSMRRKQNVKRSYVG